MRKVETFLWSLMGVVAILGMLIPASLVTGCRSIRPAPEPALLTQAARLDSVTIAMPGRPVLRLAQSPTRIGRKSTVNYYYAPAAVVTAAKGATVATGGSTASAIGKNKGNAVVASDSATLVDQHRAEQAAANTGAGSSSAQASTAKKPPWYSYLLGPIGIALGVTLLLLLFLAWLRRQAPV